MHLTSDWLSPGLLELLHEQVDLREQQLLSLVGRLLVQDLRDSLRLRSLVGKREGRRFRASSKVSRLQLVVNIYWKDLWVVQLFIGVINNSSMAPRDLVCKLGRQGFDHLSKLLFI